jgi:hypothetical protein
MELGSRAVDVAKVLGESIQVKYLKESDLLYVDGLIENCHGENKSAINEAKRLLRSIPMDSVPFFRFMQVYQGHVLGRKFFVTEDLEMGIGALFGGAVPYIVRPIEGSLDEYLFVGECYISSKWMRGVAIDLVEKGDLPTKWFKFR